MSASKTESVGHISNAHHPERHSEMKIFYRWIRDDASAKRNKFRSVRLFSQHLYQIEQAIRWSVVCVLTSFSHSSTELDSPLNYGQTYDIESRGSSGSQLSQSPPQHANGSLSSIGDNTGSYGSDILWSNWPPLLPNPELLRHLYGVSKSHSVLHDWTNHLGLTSFLCSIHMQVVYFTRQLSWTRLPYLPAIRNFRLHPFFMQYAQSEAFTRPL